MGKASKWFKGLLGFRKPDPNHNPAQKPPSKKRWSFAKSHKGSDRQKSQHGVAPGGYDDDEANRHAIAVAAATAAVAEAAVAAAQAAAAVMKLTSGGGNTSMAGSGSGFDSVAACVSQNGAGYGSREERAAVMIQSHFRAYLSRRALRALRALVKLQALVRGHISRKQNVDKLRRMQAVVRAQARARAGRVLISEAPHSSTKSSHFNHNGRASLEKVDIVTLARSTKHEHPMMLKRNGSKSNGNVTYDPEKSNSIHHWIDRRMGETLWEQESFTRIVHVDDERSDKILEVDTEKPHVMTPKRKNIIHSSHRSHSSDQYCQSFSMSKETTGLSPSSGEVQSLSPAFYTADNSPLYYSASSMGGSSKRAPFTPPKSNGSRSFLGGYSEHPSYMAYTESSKAKVRSLSAPKQRPQYERSSPVNRYSVHVYGDSRTNTQKVSPLHSNFTNKAYPGSGLLDRLGMPVRDVSGFSGGHWHRY